MGPARTPLGSDALKVTENVPPGATVVGLITRFVIAGPVVSADPPTTVMSGKRWV
jgi:hypothetical protein